VIPSVIGYRALPSSYPHDFKPGPSVGLVGVHQFTDRNSYSGGTNR